MHGVSRITLSWPNGQGVALLRRRLWVRVPPGATKLTLRTQALAAALRLARPRLPARRPLRPAAVAAARPARRLRPPGPLRRPAAVAAARRLPERSLAAAGPIAAAGRLPRPAARVRRPPLNEFWNIVRLSIWTHICFCGSLDIPRILELLLSQAAQHPSQSRPQLRRGHPDIRTNSTGGSRRIQKNLLEVEAVVVR